MEPLSLSLDLVDLLVFLGICHGFFLMALILRHPKLSQSPARYLGFMVGLVSIIGLDSWFVNFDWDEAYYLIDYLGDDVPWVLLFYVPLFRYFLLETGHPFAEKPQFHLLSLPFWLFFLLNIIVNLDIDAGLYEIPGGIRTILIIYTAELSVALLLSLILAGIAGFHVFKGEHSSTQNQPLRRIWVATTLMLGAWVGTVLLPEFEGEWSHRIDQIFWGSVCLGLYWTVYKSLFPRVATISSPGPDRQEAEELIQRPPASDHQYLQQLADLMLIDRLFVDPDLGRDQVAMRLGISPGYLSQVLSRSDAGTFTQYVNAFRVKEVKAMLTDPAYAHFSLLAIGMEAGFKSKSAFYTTFKKISGMTPKAYKEAQQ